MDHTLSDRDLECRGVVSLKAQHVFKLGRRLVHTLAVQRLELLYELPSLLNVMIVMIFRTHINPFTIHWIINDFQTHLYLCKLILCSYFLRANRIRLSPSKSIV